jgi:aconitate hydratase
MVFDIDMIKKSETSARARGQSTWTRGKPLTLSEKILYAHLWMRNATKAFTDMLIMLILPRPYCLSGCDSTDIAIRRQAGKSKVAVPHNGSLWSSNQPKQGAVKTFACAWS